MGIFNSNMIIRRYFVKVKPDTPKLRIALVSDLHSCKYGENMSELIDNIENEKPDIVAMAGDIFDRFLHDENSFIFLKRISEKYPCYFVTGNHEYSHGEDYFNEMTDYLSENGIKRLSTDIETIEKDGKYINICGIDDPNFYKDFCESREPTYYGFYKQLDELTEKINNEYFTVLLSHRPEKFEDYVSRKYDLVLCGHSHGGQFRIPYVMNGLLAPHQGFFPKYAGGEYKKDGTTMIVSRGLARETTRVPRIFNRPELVIIQCC